MLKLSYAGAQDITGTWEGELGNDQFLQVNVIQVKNKLCGYTWDYVKADHRSYCKAYFTGSYNKRRKEWALDGESFIENSGGHVLMRLKLYTGILNGKTILLGDASIQSSGQATFGKILGVLLGGQGAEIGNRDERIRLKKISDKPQQVLKNMQDCDAEKKASMDTAVKSPVIDTIVKASAPIITHTDTIVNIKPVVKKPDSVLIPQQMVQRKNIEEGHVVVNTKNITLNLYDNAIVDGDTISVFFNGKLLLSHQRLTEKPIVINIELDENSLRNEITLFAENLGSIPPNTALIVVTAGDKRYELFSKASLDENAVLVFEYKP